MLKEILQGRFMNHPLHPLLVHLPVGLWAISLVFDLLYFGLGNSTYAISSYYCLAAGIIGAILAVPAGLAEYIDIPSHTRPKKIAAQHMTLNLLVAGLYVINFFIRHGMEKGVPTAVTGFQLLVSAISVGILSYSGYLGGKLVYEYGIGFQPQARDRNRDEQLRKVA